MWKGRPADLSLEGNNPDNPARISAANIVSRSVSDAKHSWPFGCQVCTHGRLK